MKRTITTVRICNNRDSVPPLHLNLIQTAPIYRVALTANQLTLVADGGAGGYTYAATGLPAGLSLNTATGAITGTPTTIAHSVITASVTDSASTTVTATFSIDVVTRLVVTANSPPDCAESLAYSYQFGVSGATGAVTWTTAGFNGTPIGLSLSSVGVLSGTMFTVAPYTYVTTVTATDAGTGDDITFAVNLTLWKQILADHPWLGLGTVQANVPTSIAAAELFSWGKPPIRYSPILLPTWLTWDAVKSIASGTPHNSDTGATQHVQIHAYDVLGISATAFVEIDVLRSANIAIQPQKAASNVGTAGPGTINFEFPATGTPDVTNVGGIMTVTIPTAPDSGYDATVVHTTRTVNGHALSADVTVTKADVGLGSVDNTSDLSKPVSTATQAALDGKADESDLLDGLTNNQDTALGVGALALLSAPGFNQNVAIGYQALAYNAASVASSGFQNTAIGWRALFYLPGNTGYGGYGNTAIGVQALLNVSSGFGNFGVGRDAGITITTGAYNICIGYAADVPSASANGQMSIANIIYGFDNIGLGATVSTGRICIGTKTDDGINRLQVNGNVAATGLVLSGSTSQYVRGDGSLATFPSGGSGTVTSVAAGNGMVFTNITTSGAVALGTPSSCSPSTSNNVTTYSHTHALTGVASPPTTCTASTGNTDSGSSHTHNITGFLPLTGGTLTGTLTGTTIQASTIKETSDARFKSNVRDLSDAMEIVRGLMPRRFYNTRTEDEEVGLIAQEVRDYLPEVISTDDNGDLAVSYQRVVVPLIGAVHALDARLKRLEALLK